MPFDLKVHFEYLCAFVPHDPFEKAPKECFVVLPDFTGLKTPNEPHYPCVLYHRDHRADEELKKVGLTPRPPSTKFPPPHNANRRLILCEAEEIEIQPDGKKPNNNTLSVPGTLPSLMRIASANLGLEKFKRSLVENPTPAGIAARMHLREGVLSEAEVTSQIFGLKNMKTGKVVKTQQMARRITLSISSVNFVDFVFRKLSSPPQQERVLRLRTSKSTSEVTIRNCEDKFIWKTKWPPYNHQLDGEINLYFPLSANYDPHNKPPAMVLNLIPTPAGPNGVCAPKAFDGWA